MIPQRANFTRRDFLRTSALVGTGDAALGNSGVALAAEPTATDLTWFDKPMRLAQLVLVENDPGQYSPQFWLDYFKRTHSDAACLSAGGCVASYPTKIPLHYRSRFLGDRDSSGE